MKKIIERYPFQINLFYTLITLTVAILLTVFNSEQIIVPALGFALIVFAIYQLVHLLKNRSKGLAIKIYAMEIAAQVIIGAILIYIVFFSEVTLGVFFGYLLGGLLITRGTLYLYGKRVDDPKDELGTFLIHIAAISAGTYLIIQGDFTAGVMSGIIIAVALKRSFKTGYKAFKIYRQSPEPKKAISATLNDASVNEQGSEPTQEKNAPRLDSIQWKE